MLPGVEYWPQQLAESEEDAFRQRYGSLIGLSADALIDQFGEPSNKVRGSSIFNDGQQITHAEEWWYCQLLPHTVVNMFVSVSETNLERVAFFPKLMTCPTHLIKCYGVLFAPDNAPEKTQAES